MYGSHMFERYTLWVRNLIKVKIECGVNQTHTKCTQLVQCKNIIMIHIKYLSITLSTLMCMADYKIMSHFLDIRSPKQQKHFLRIFLILLYIKPSHSSDL